MQPMITAPVTTLVDIRCFGPECGCKRSIRARLVARGTAYRADEASPSCPDCAHSYRSHEVIGRTPSRAEKSRRVTN